jgi:molybdopterin molybdotransferase
VGLSPVGVYLAEVLRVVRPLTPRQLSLDEADGATLAADVTAAYPLPAFGNSAMDGYAVRAADVAAASATAPVILPVEAEIAAGDPRELALPAGTCMRIMTGAPVPSGADAVVRVEWTDGGSVKAAISQPVKAGDSVRPAGSDAQRGEVLLTAGTPLRAPQLGLLAAAGHGSVLARPRPRVTVLSAGNELAPPGTALRPGQVYDANSFLLATAARQAGCVTARPPAVRDERDQVLAAVRAAADGADLLVTSGGISMGGEHDTIKAALRAAGGFTFRRVAMQPGMPQGYGVTGAARTPVLTLPGNPVSAYVSFCLFAVPAIRVLQGRPPEPPHTPRAVLTGPVRSAPGKTAYVSGTYDPRAGTVTPAPGRSTHHLTGLARASALIIVPGHVTSLDPGDTVSLLELPT